VLRERAAEDLDDHALRVAIGLGPPRVVGLDRDLEAAPVVLQRDASGGPRRLDRGFQRRLTHRAGSPRERLAALGEHLGVDVQRVDHDGHPAVGGHLEDDLGHLLPRGADVQRRVDVGAHLVGPVQRRERRDGAQLALPSAR